mmetsp:Transcript_26089/g.61505  ORF Transcript_26089/g.61505 Transcript_26089/m.61505 type:complete len:210 (-) Transcript_26089:23-652(-)
MHDFMPGSDPLCVNPGIMGMVPSQEMQELVYSFMFDYAFKHLCEEGWGQTLFVQFLYDQGLRLSLPSNPDAVCLWRRHQSKKTWAHCARPGERLFGLVADSVPVFIEEGFIIPSDYADCHNPDEVEGGVFCGAHCMGGHQCKAAGAEGKMRPLVAFGGWFLKEEWDQVARGGDPAAFFEQVTSVNPSDLEAWRNGGWRPHCLTGGEMKL